jgi:hypothetical protein
VSIYRVTLDAMTNTGKPLVEAWQAEVVAAVAEDAWGHARREFFSCTRLLSGVRLVARTVERRWESGRGYTPLITAYRAVPGTWIKLESITSDGRPWFGWRQVDRWEPEGDGSCRLVTTDLRNPYGGCYTREHVFETR